MHSAKLAGMPMARMDFGEFYALSCELLRMHLRTCCRVGMWGCVVTALKTDEARLIWGVGGLEYLGVRVFRG